MRHQQTRRQKQGEHQGFTLNLPTAAHKAALRILECGVFTAGQGSKPGRVTIQAEPLLRLSRKALGDLHRLGLAKRESAPGRATFWTLTADGETHLHMLYRVD